MVLVTKKCNSIGTNFELKFVCFLISRVQILLGNLYILTMVTALSNQEI